MQLRYGMNPHQAARARPAPGSDRMPLRVCNGKPSYVNLLDALNGWQLVREAAAATGLAAAASFKHVSPAGAALAGELDGTARRDWRLTGALEPVTAAYARARDADPKSSFGDVIAVSEPVGMELAELVSRVVSDGIVAPGYEPGAAAVLARKKSGTFLVLEADPAYEPPPWEARDVFGLVLEQERDRAVLSAELLQTVDRAPLSETAVRDALLGLATLRYTQSNSVALVRDGSTVGVGAGQQNRVDCVRLAVAKATTWWLRRHPRIQALPQVAGMTRQDRLNWQIRLAEGALTPGQARELEALFPGVAPSWGEGVVEAWVAGLGGVTLASDGFLPFRDNVEVAGRIGVAVVVEPGGSTRSSEVEQACSEQGITLVRTGLRLFHH